MICARLWLRKGANDFSDQERNLVYKLDYHRDYRYNPSRRRIAKSKNNRGDQRMASGDENNRAAQESADVHMGRHEVTPVSTLTAGSGFSGSRDIAPSQSVSIMDTIQRAVLKGDVDISVIDKLVSLHERFAAVEAKRQFDEAFARAKGEIRVVEKDAHVGYEAKASNADDRNKPKDRTDYDYATLASIYDAAVPALSKYGLSYDFDIKQEVVEGGSMKITVGCVVTHAGGHSKRVEMFGPPEAGGNKPIHKAIASAVTIFSRLTLKAALGLAERKDPSDDDGKAADEAMAQASGPAMISDEQVAELKRIIDDVGANTEAFCNHLKVDRLEDLPASRFGEAKQKLEWKRSEEAKNPRGRK